MRKCSQEQVDAVANDVVTVECAAKYLGLHPKTVCAYIREGKIRAARCGRCYRIRRQWLLDFLDGEQAGNSGE